MSVTRDVIVGIDRARGDTAVPPTPQRLGHQPETRRGYRPRRQIGPDGRIALVEFAGHRVDVVPALGHRQRDDPGRRVGHLLDDRLRVVRSQQIIDDRADDAGRPGPVRILEHQRVQAVGRPEDYRACARPVGGRPPRRCPSRVPSPCSSGHRDTPPDGHGGIHRPRDGRFRSVPCSGRNAGRGSRLVARRDSPGSAAA
jgi:hypothetical protein